MTVKELIEALSKLPGDTIVLSYNDYGEEYEIDLDLEKDKRTVYKFKGHRERPHGGIEEVSYISQTYYQYSKEDICLGEFKAIKL